MKETQAAAMQLVLAHEGGLADHPKDPGGRTMKGVTQKVYDAYRTLRGLPLRDVALINDQELNDIYDTQYWDRAACDSLPAGLDYAVFDYSVNSGVGRAIKDLQKCVGAAQDGVMGNGTLTKVVDAMAMDEEGFIAQYIATRVSFLRGLKTWKTFGIGWLRRVVGDHEGAQDDDDGVYDYAIKFARRDLTYPIRPQVLPSAIGSKVGELPGKAPEASVAKSKTMAGIGTTLASMGVTGQAAIATAQTVKPHVGDGPIGKLALAAFILLMAAGVLLFALDFYNKFKAKTDAA
jgi:lysozyme family protein